MPELCEHLTFDLYSYRALYDTDGFRAVSVINRKIRESETETQLCFSSVSKDNSVVIEISSVWIQSLLYYWCTCKQQVTLNFKVSLLVCLYLSTE